MNLEIRFCIKDDFSSVFNLLKQLWPDKELSYESLQIVYNKAIVSEKQRLIVGETNNQIIGFCSLTIKNNLWQVGNLGHVDELIVDDSVRGKGYGKFLLEKITQIAMENNCKRIELDSAFHRESAHNFYENSGYENRAYLFSKVLDN